MKSGVVVGLVTILSLHGIAHTARQDGSSTQGGPAPALQPSTSGAIRGRAIEVDTNRPMRRVVVSCVSDQGVSVDVTTGADGRYELKNLSPGRCILSARRSGYLASPTRARALSPQPIPIDVAAGEPVEDVNFKLVRAGAISGRIVDEFGDAVVNAHVTARRWVFAEGARRLQVAAATNSDDLGEFRLSDLVAGSYYVAAVYPSPAAKTIGRRTGSKDPLVSWACYPGVPTAAQAQRIPVREGHDTTGIDFALITQRCPSVSGTVLDSLGRPAVDAMVALSSAGGEGGAVRAIDAPARTPVGVVLSGVIASGLGTAVRAPRGSFLFPWVWPGEYVLTAHAQIGRSAGIEFAAQSLSVVGEDVANVNLVMVGGGDPILGRIRSDGKPPDFSPDRLRVRLVSEENEDLMDRLALPISGPVKADWTFELTRIPSLRLLRVDGLPADWAVKAVTLDTRTITDALVELTAVSPPPPLNIILTNHPTELSGEVVGPDDDRISDYAVVVFASDRSRWPFAPRFVQVERPNQHGRFRILGLAPGDFLVAAVEYVDETEWRDPEFLERLRPFATPVTVKEGASTEMTLRLVAGGRQ